MNKYLKIMLVFLLAFLFVPMVKAEEIPTSGVTYFMQYPDGHEEVTENYNEAVNAGEKLIYSGVTDENGEVPLCGWSSEGELRIVQHVPDGYTTNVREVRVDLSKDNGANFVNYKGLVNPSTGTTLLFIVVIAAVAGVTVIARKNKKALMIIPVVIGTFMIVDVQAQGTCFCVKVKDGSGKALSGVRVDVYAKPEIEAAPAMSFDADGGYFFDGSTKMYFRLPNATCSVDELMDSLTDEEYDFWEANSFGAYRSGYVQDGYDWPPTLSNGTVIPLIWYEDGGEERSIKISGNGGTYNFYGEDLTSIVIDEDNVYQYARYFENGDSHFIGLDDNAACTHYNQYGISTMGHSETPIFADNEESTVKRDEFFTVYACWNNNPDGIYVNDDAVFVGGPASCFEAANMYPYDSNGFELYIENSQHGYYLDVGQFNSDVRFFYEAYNPHTELDAVQAGNGSSDTINKLEVIKNGQVVVSLTSSDLMKQDGVYYISNTTKKNAFINYMNEFNNYSCFYGGEAVA